MNTTSSAPTANITMRQRITSTIALVAFILAMLLGGGAPHNMNTKPQASPTPTAISTP